MAASMKTWVAGTAGLCVVVLGLGGFLLVKPKLDERSTLQEETAQLALSNDSLENEVGVLREQFASIDQFRDDLAKERVRIPEKADLASLLKEIDTQATTHGVTLITSSPASAETYELAEEEETTEPEPAATESADSADAAEPTPEPSATSAGAGSIADALAEVLSQVEGMYVIPVTVDVVGDYANIQSFINGLQTETQRFFLLGSFTMTRLETADAGKLPATTAGQVEIAMEIGAYTLLPSEGAAVEDESADSVPVDPGRNPFDNGVAGTNG